MEKDKKIFVAGASGLVGSAIIRKLEGNGYSNIVAPTHAQLDLTSQADVNKFMKKEKPAYVFIAAAKVGGIMANSTYRADFIYENLMIECNLIHSAWENGVEKLLFLGSSCIYPKNCEQPMREECLLTSELEYTNEPYAVAKIAGMKMCESYNIQYGTNFLSVMPTNLYGYNDNFSFENSHVLPAIMRKIHLAKTLEKHDGIGLVADFSANPVKGVDSNSANEIVEYLKKQGVSMNDAGEVEVVLWGSGTPYREFLWSDDMASACVYVMESVNWSDLVCGDDKEIKNRHINIGSGKEVSISELADMIKKVVGFNGKIVFDESKPDGTMRKLTDTSKLKSLGWRYKVELEDGVKLLYRHYCQK